MKNLHHVLWAAAGALAFWAWVGSPDFEAIPAAIIAATAAEFIGSD